MGIIERGTGLITSLASRSDDRPPFEGVYIYIFCFLVGYAIADLSILSIRPKMMPTQVTTNRPAQVLNVRMAERPEYDVVTERNLFNSDGVIPPAMTSKEEQVPTEDGPATLSQLPLQLEGTIVHVDPERSLSTINLKNRGETKPFIVGQDIDGMATVTRIERRKVTFRNLSNGRLEFIEIPKDSKITFGMKADAAGSSGGDIVKRGEFDFVVKRSDITKYTSDLPSILNQARMVPNIIPGSGGKVDGFRFVSIQPGSIYEKLGFKPMDIIKSVNGDLVNSPTKAMELYNALRAENRIQLSVERGGREETFRYDIGD